jgi:hypothetical protein
MHLINKILLPAAIILVFIFLPAKSAKCNEMQYFHPIDDNLLAEEAFLSVTESFAAMNECLSADFFKDGYYTLKAVKEKEEVYEFLQQAGFTASLSNRIIQSYLLRDPDSTEALLIPTEGLPVLELKDRLNTEYFPLDSYHIIFRSHFYDCYQFGDQYSLFIAAYREEEKWFISEWQLFEAVND